MMENNLPQKREQEIQPEYTIHGHKFSGQDYRVLHAGGLVNDGAKVRKLKDVPKLDARKELSFALIKAQEILRHGQLESNDALMMAGDVYDETCRTYPHMKLEEVLATISFGSYGKYDTNVVYLSASNVLRWLRHYLKQKYTITDGYLKAKEKQALRDALNVAKQKEKEYWQRFPDMVASEFMHYKVNGGLSESADRICKGLNAISYKSTKNGFLGDIVDKDLKRVWKQKETEKEMYRLGKYDSTMIDNKLTAVYDNFTLGKDYEQKVLNICRKMALEYFFKITDNIYREELMEHITNYQNEEANI